MARSSIRVPTRGQRLPRLTSSNRRVLPPQAVGKAIDNWIDESLEDELRLTAFLDVNTRRQVRLATGIGDMNAYVDQFNKGFADTSQLSPEKSKRGKEAFGEAFINRPKLKKISIEGRIVYQPTKK